MSTQIRIRRGTKAELGTITLALGELGFTTDEKKVYVGDGTANYMVGQVQTGVLAQRPAPGQSGNVYFATDTNETFIDDGSNWQQANTIASLDDVPDGTLYSRVLATEVTAGKVTRIDDGSNAVTAAETRTHLDNASIHFTINDAGSSPTETLSSQYVKTRLEEVITGVQRKTAVINIVDNTVIPPTENAGDRYILDFAAGTVHVNWDGASPGDIVEFDGTNWLATTPSEGLVVYVDDENKDAIFVDDGTPMWELRPIAITNHNDLAGKQGGTTNEFYHLTAAEYSRAQNPATNAQDGYMTSADHQLLPTTSEKEALAGTAGSPADANRFVTDQDTRIPSQDENDALVGTVGTPGAANPFVTTTDSRMTDARVPTAHATSHQHGGSDEIATATPTGDAIPKANASGDLNNWITLVDGGVF